MIERAQASHEFDLDLADLEVRQQSTWQGSTREVSAEKCTTSSTNIGSGDNKDCKPRIDSQGNSFAQQGSVLRPVIQGSGTLAWDLCSDPEDYIWALDWS